MAKDAGANAGATAIKDVESSFLVTYNRPPKELLVWAVQQRLNTLAAKGKSGPGAKLLVSGIQLVKKLHMIWSIITDVHASQGGW